ncbi:MAG: DUF1553 domain-containing protein [Blastocatellia bacterium]
MPTAGSHRNSSPGRPLSRTRRLTALALTGIALIFAFDLAGWQTSSLAARAGKQRRTRIVARPATQTPPRARTDAEPKQTPSVARPGAGRTVEDTAGTASPEATINDCTYFKDPENPRDAQTRHRTAVWQATEAVSGSVAQRETSLVSATEIPRRNFIDTILFDRMVRDNVASAPLCSDAEFLRRAYLDLTGRIPAADDVTRFLADISPTKRDALVDALIGTPEFADKWTVFFGDLFRNTSAATNINRYIGGRDAFYKYIRDAIVDNKGYDRIATEMMTASGDSFVNGEVNFIVGGNVAMGPAQDTMDGLAVQISSTFLGISSMDCLFCHDGAGHLDAVNLWGAQQKRADAWGVAAFFARTRRAATTISQSPFYAKYAVTENATGEYTLNTTTGNRTARTPVNGKNTADPKYLFNAGGGVNTGENRRQALARLITTDPQFARAAVNYIWEKLMVEALVSPSNTFDLARVSPNAQLPTGWTLQPANAELLAALADEFKRDSFNIRNLIAMIVKSSAYQLSAQYPGAWKLEYLPYYARKYVRRLDAEEVHDAIVKATGIFPTSGSPAQPGYELRADDGVTVTGRVQWAMQLPEPREPRRDGTGRVFLDSFLRGDRDTKPRTLDPSILQALNLMNSSFVMNRIHQRNAGSTVQKLLADAKASDNNWIIEQLYLTTLARKPTQAEKDKILPYFTSLGKQSATESLQWVLLNKVDFIFNY